jgi:hypothetical protein
MQRPNLIQSSVLALATSLIMAIQPISALAAPGGEPTAMGHGTPGAQSYTPGDGLHCGARRVCAAGVRPHDQQRPVRAPQLEVGVIMDGPRR